MNWSSLTSANQFFWWLVSANSSTTMPSFISHSRLVAGFSCLVGCTALNNASPSPWTRYGNHRQFSLFLGWKNGSVTLGNAMGSMGSTFPTWRLRVYFGWFFIELVDSYSCRWVIAYNSNLCFPSSLNALWALNLTPDSTFAPIGNVLMRFTVCSCIRPCFDNRTWFQSRTIGSLTT